MWRIAIANDKLPVIFDRHLLFQYQNGRSAFAEQVQNFLQAVLNPHYRNPINALC